MYLFCDVLSFRRARSILATPSNIAKAFIGQNFCCWGWGLDLPGWGVETVHGRRVVLTIESDGASE